MDTPQNQNIQNAEHVQILHKYQKIGFILNMSQNRNEHKFQY